MYLEMSGQITQIKAHVDQHFNLQATLGSQLLEIMSSLQQSDAKKGKVEQITRK